MKKLLSILLVLVLLLTSCSFPERIPDIPKAEEVQMIRIFEAGCLHNNAHGKDFTDPDDIRTILSALSAVELEYEETAARYGGTECIVLCFRKDGSSQSFGFPGEFDEYAVWVENDIDYYNILSGGKELAEIYGNATLTEQHYDDPFTP